MPIRPIDEHAPLDAPLIDSHALSVQGGEIIGRDFRIAGCDHDVVRLRAHRKRGIQHVFGALLCIGHIAQQVDFSIFEHLQKLGPGAFNVVVVPAGIGGNLALVFVGITGAAAELVGSVEGRLVPADAHGLSGGILGKRRSRQSEGKRQDAGEQQRRDPPHAMNSPLVHPFQSSPIDSAITLDSHASYRAWLAGYTP